MGNEMGNNNTSGLREEDSSASEAQLKSVQELVDVSVLKEENDGVTTEESKDYHEKVTGLDSDDQSVEKPVDVNVLKEENHLFATKETKEYQEEVTGLDSDDLIKGSGDTHDHNQTSDETEHTEVHPTAEFPKAEIEPNEIGGEVNEFEPASFSNELEDHEKSTDSNMEENGLGANSDQLGKQASFKKEEEEIMSTSHFVTMPPSHDLEPQDSVELKESYADQPVQESTSSLKPSEDIQGSSVAGITEENGHLLDTCPADNLDGIFSSATNLEVEEKRGDLSEKEMASKEDELLSEEKIQVEVGNDLSKTVVVNAATILSDFRSDHIEKCERGFTSEMDCHENNCSESQPEANLTANSLNSHAELSVPEDKCMVVSEETEFTRKESELEVNEHHYNLNWTSEDSIRESDIDLANASQTDSFPSYKNDEENLVNVSHDPGSNGSFQVEEAKVAENGYHIDLFNGIQSEASEGSCKESERDTMVVPELGMLPELLSMSNGKGNEKETDCKLEEEKPAENHFVEEIKEKKEAPCAAGHCAEEQQNGEQFVSKSLSVQAEAYAPQALASLFQSQDQQQETVMVSGNAQGSNKLNLELKPESCKDSIVEKASTDQATCINILETSAPAVETLELGMDKPQQEASYHVIAAPEIVRETKSLAFEQCEKLETTIFPKSGYEEAQETVGRFSIESNPDNPNIHVQMRKSPSFDLDLRIEARSEESDQTPLLCQDKTTIESLSSQADVSLRSPHLLSQYNQESLRAKPVEERVVSLERSDSEKSRTPFLGFLKEDEEAHVVVTPKKQDHHPAAKKATKDFWNSSTKEVASASPKGKEKHKRRTSLFGQCICCATVI